MATVATPKTWIPYMNTRDCTRGFCSLYCPEWCYIVFPPPPLVEFPGESSGSSFSPLVISIIGILASAFLLITYYTIISKYCGDKGPSRREEGRVQNVELGEEDRDASLHDPWQAFTTGLDEALIKSIAVYKYRRGDGAVDGTDCSVCLSEFEEDQSVRLLPKCSHAFHVTCIDSWLKCHSNCPLCRANIFFPSAPMPRSPPQSNNGSSSLNGQGNNENEPATDQNNERVVVGEEMEPDNRAPEVPLHALSDLGNLHQREIISEVRDRGNLDIIRRTVSMDHRHSRQAPYGSEEWRMVQDEQVSLEEGYSGGVGTSISKSTPRKKVVLHCLRSPLASRRSFPSGRFFVSARGRSRDTAISLT